MGHDFSDADASGLKKILQYEKSQGVTSYCPTSMTLPIDQLIRIFASAAEVEQDESCARIVGLNMEGPFLDPAKRGLMMSGISEIRILSSSESARRCPAVR